MSSQGRKYPSVAHTLSVVLPPVSSSGSQGKINDLKKVYGTSQDRLGTASTYQSGRRISYNVTAIRPRVLTDPPISVKKYGRDEASDQLDTLRDELFQAKKRISKLSQENKEFSTKMMKLNREAERREMHLHHIVANKFQPSELNDTQLALTLSTMKRKDIENEHIINYQQEEISKLRNLLGERGMTVDDDQDESGTGSKEGSSTSKPTNGSEELASLKERHKRKMSIAKAHIEQNSQLRQKIQEMDSERNTLKQEIVQLKKKLAKLPKITPVNATQQDHVQQKGTNAVTMSPDRQLAALKEEHSKVVESLQRDKEDWVTEKSELVDEKQKLEERNRELENNIEKFHEREVEYEDVISNLRSDNDKLKLELQTGISSPGEFKKKKYDGLFYGESIEDTDISLPSTSNRKEQGSTRPENVPPLNMEAVSDSTVTTPIGSVNSHVGEDETPPADHVQMEAETSEPAPPRTIATPDMDSEMAEMTSLLAEALIGHTYIITLEDQKKSDRNKAPISENHVDPSQ